MLEKKMRCENCGRFPFCVYADKTPKDNCKLWIKRNIEGRLNFGNRRK